MSTRDLRVRFIGDASGLKSSFAEANAAAAGVSTGLKQADVSANTVGKSFTRTSKIFKGAGKVIKSSGLDAAASGASFLSMVPALSGVASGMGAVTVAGDALLSTTSALGAYAIPAMAVAALAAGAAFVALRGNASWASEQIERLNDAANETREAHIDVARSALFQKRAIEDLSDAQLAQQQSSLGLWQAQHDLAEIAKTNGKNSLAYKQALLQVKQAEDAVSDARRETIHQAQDVIRLTEKRSQATQREKAGIAKERAELDKLTQAYRRGMITGDAATAYKKRMAAVTEAEAKASQKAAARHKANGQAALDAANKLRGDASPAAKELREKLLELANTELDMSSVISAMNNLATAAGSAAAGVVAAADAIRNMPTTITVPTTSRGGGPGGKPAPGNPGVGNKPALAQSIEMGRRGITPRRGELSSLGFDAIAGMVIDRRHRDDSLQDKVASSRAAAAAKRRGITNPDKVSAMEDKRVAELRKRELTADVGTVKRQRIKLRQRIVALRKRLAQQRTSRQKAKKDDQPDWDSRIQDTIGRIRGLWDQDRAMSRTLAELKAEAKELDFDINALGDQLGSLPDSVPDDAAEPEAPATAMDFAEAEVAKAALTDDKSDDVTAAEGLVGVAEGEYNAALASGDPRRIRDAAGVLASARAALQNAKDLRDNTDALNANTDAITGAFGGSTTFQYGGQNYVLRSLAPPSSDDLRMGAI